MSSRKSSRLKQQSEDISNVRRSTRVRRSVVVFTDDLDLPENEEQLPRKKPIGRCNNKKQKPLAAEQEQEQQLLEPLLVTFGHEIPPGETRDGVPVVVVPSSPEEEKPRCDLLFLPEPPLKPEDRQVLLNAASVFKFKLVSRLKSSADNLSHVGMMILASRCYDILEELEDDYSSFRNQVKKLIAQHHKVESAAKDKENWDNWDMKARYVHQLQFHSEVRQKLSSAQDKLSEAKTKVDYLMFKKEEMTDALRMLTEELYEEEEKVKTLTVERDQFQEDQFDAEVGLGKLDAEKKEASVAFEAYNAAKEEFESMSNHLLQLVKK